MIIYKNPVSIVTRYDIPNGNWTEDTDVFIVDDHSELGQKILQYAPFFELVLDDEGNLIDATRRERPVPPPEPPTETELMQGELGHMVFRNAIEEMKISSLETTVAQLVAQSAEDKEKIGFLENTVGDLVSTVGELLSIVGKLKGGIF